jgi:hypothetical protein
MGNADECFISVSNCEVPRSAKRPRSGVEWGLRTVASHMTGSFAQHTAAKHGGMVSLGTPPLRESVTHVLRICVTYVVRIFCNLCPGLVQTLYKGAWREKGTLSGAVKVAGLRFAGPERSVGNRGPSGYTVPHRLRCGVSSLPKIWALDRQARFPRVTMRFSTTRNPARNNFNDPPRGESV